MTKTLDLSWAVEVALYMQRAARLLERTSNQVARASFFLNELNAGRVPPVNEDDCRDFLALLAERQAAQPAKRGRKKSYLAPTPPKPFCAKEALKSAAYGTILKALSRCECAETCLAGAWQFLNIWAEFYNYEEPTRKHAEQFLTEFNYCIRVAMAGWPFDLPPGPRLSIN
jgi:hypothetical protein